MTTTARQDFPDITPLGHARGWVNEHSDHGVVCPCCGQRAQVYRRAITSTMAQQLITCYRAAGIDRPFHLPTVLGHGGDAAKLSYCGLLVEDVRPRDDGGRAGWWVVTALGGDFARGLITVPRHALVYNGALLRTDGDPVSIVQCLGKRFNLRALLAGEA
jgi:hypothetical protein